VFAWAAVGASVATAQSIDAEGWTVLTPPAGARVVYVSSSVGNDSNDGLSEKRPVRTLTRGYELVRDGQPDQMLLRSGDVWKKPIEDWKKSANSTTQYMVIGAYGTGPRPRIDSGEASGFSSLSGEPRRGLAIVGIEFASNGRGVSESAGIEFIENWGHVLIEDCFVSRYRDNIAVVPLKGLNRIKDVQIRRSVMVESYHTGTGHSQGVFLGNCDNWLIEECVLDRNAYNRDTIFCHNIYVHESCGPGTFRGNISARACSHGIQQRPGGIAENNLMLRNAIGILLGRSATSPTEANVVRYNVVQDGKDINPHETRAQGLEISDVWRVRVERNLIAHQLTGTGNIDAIAFTRSLNATVRDNVVYEWSRPGFESSVALFWGGACGGDCVITGNRFHQSAGGLVVAHGFDSPFLPSFRYSQNHYFSINPLNVYLWFANDSTFLTNPQWVDLAGDPGSTFVPVMFPDKDRSIETYAKSLGLAGSMDVFLKEARRQSKSFWRAAFTASEANRWIRGGFGIYCPVDMNRDGYFTTADYSAFVAAFQGGNLLADVNRDGVLNILDFLAFQEAADEGCP
jgi:hypothetical protein